MYQLPASLLRSEIQVEEWLQDQISNPVVGKTEGILSSTLSMSFRLLSEFIKFAFDEDHKPTDGELNHGELGQKLSPFQVMTNLEVVRLFAIQLKDWRRPSFCAILRKCGSILKSKNLLPGQTEILNCSYDELVKFFLLL